MQEMPQARSEALGQFAHELLKPESAEPIEQMHSTLLGHGLWEGTMIHHRRDGSRVMVATRCALQRSADGAPARILTINTDITKR
jgi:PAS domain-containing protein